MRHIGNVSNEKDAFVFYSYLMEAGIHSTYEKQEEGVSIWIYEEDEAERAQELLQEFKENPNAEKFAKIEYPTAPPQPPDLIAEKKEKATEEPPPRPGLRFKLKAEKRKTHSYPLTYMIILLCVFLYFWNGAQQVNMLKTDGKLALQIGLTPIQQKLMFDYPQSNQKVDQLLEKYNLKTQKDLANLPSSELAEFKAAEQIPTWRGVLQLILDKFKKKPETKDQGPLFEKIKQGQVYRIFTPILLHGGLLHILFNMAWAWLLLRQVEERLSKWKIIFLILLIALVSNVAQYLVSGPYFLGFSGVICGLVGFIWVRQKVAPWEGYPLHKSTIIFILIFVAAMFVLEVFSLVTAAITAKEISANIANTAHIIGGLTGALLGKVSFFSRGMK